jgi:hypothetical protein
LQTVAPEAGDAHAAYHFRASGYSFCGGRRGRVAGERTRGADTAERVQQRAEFAALRFDPVGLTDAAIIGDAAAPRDGPGDRRRTPLQKEACAISRSRPPFLLTHRFVPQDLARRRIKGVLRFILAPSTAVNNV